MSKYKKYMDILNRLAKEDENYNCIIYENKDLTKRKYTWFKSDNRLLANKHNDVVELKDKSFDLQYSELRKVFSLCSKVRQVTPTDIVKIVVYNNIVTFMIRNISVLTTRTIYKNNITFHIPYTFLNKINILNIDNKAKRVDAYIKDGICYFTADKIIYGINIRGQI